MGHTLPAEMQNAHIVSHSAVSPDLSMVCRQMALTDHEIAGGIKALEATHGTQHPMAAMLGGELAKSGFSLPTEQAEVTAPVASVPAPQKDFGGRGV